LTLPVYPCKVPPMLETGLFVVAAALSIIALMGIEV
jgi:hypothetical protein